MVRQHARWLEEAGVEVPRRPDGEPRHRVEIHPLVARAPEDVREAVQARGITRVESDLHLAPEDE
jgi:hypothetical protein